MKTLTLILIALTLFSCEKTETFKRICVTEYNLTWFVSSHPQFKFEIEESEYIDLMIDVNEKPFYNFEVQENMIIFNATNEIRDKCKVDVVIKVVQGLKNLNDTSKALTYEEIIEIYNVID